MIDTNGVRLGEDGSITFSSLSPYWLHIVKFLIVLMKAFGNRDTEQKHMVKELERHVK